MSQIVTLSNNGWEIGSHGHSHRAYNRMENFEINQDLQISKRILEDITCKEVDSFCPPFGIIPKECIADIIKTGYKNLFVQMLILNKK